MVPPISVECQILMAYEGEVPGFARRLSVRHRHCVWWHILSGTVSVMTVGEAAPDRVVAEKGATVFIAPGGLREHRFSAGARVVSVHFAVDAADGRPLFPALPLIVWPPGEGADGAAQAARRLVQCLRAAHGGSPADALRAQAQLYGFAAAVLDALETTGIDPADRASADPRLETVFADLARAPRAGPLPIARWARLTGLGRSQLDRLCRQYCGESLRARRDAILVARLERALAADTRGIKALAYEHGFIDASHLTRWFRAQSGTTPGAFRRSVTETGFRA